MRGSLGVRVARARWLWRRRPADRAFRAALERPEAVQLDRLRALLRRNAGSAYGRTHGFDRIESFADYQSRVPVVTYEALEPWVRQILDGRPSVLTAEPVLMVEPTGGSTGGPKLVPYTRSLLAEFQGAVSAWMADLYARVPGLGAGGAYWSVTPLTRPRTETAGGLRVGLDDDTEYFAPAERRFLRRCLVTPPGLGRVEDLATSRYLTLRCLVDTPHLAFISVWNPSFLTRLMAALAESAPRLLDDLERGTLTPPAPLPSELEAAVRRRLRPQPRRARRLRAALAASDRLAAVDLWPGLRLLSCWTDAAAARALPALRALFPGVPIQGKGLLATEGVVSIPLWGHPGAVLAVTAHVYEFVPADEGVAGAPRLAHELEPGRTYTVLLTTGGGLYRYALGDAVRVVGRVGRTPLVEFVGRAGGVSDLCGEKLSERHVEAALGIAAARFGLASAFLMLAPEWASPPHYTLFVEATHLPADALASLLALVDAELQRNPAYAYCRALGQLGRLRGIRVTGDAPAAYLDRCAALGQRVGAVKPVALHPATGWQAHLEGTPV